MIIVVFFHHTCNSLATIILKYVSHNSDLLLYKYISSFKADLQTKKLFGEVYIIRNFDVCDLTKSYFDYSPAFQGSANPRFVSSAEAAMHKVNYPEGMDC